MKSVILIFWFSYFSFILQIGPQSGLFGTSAQTSPFGSTSAGTSTAGAGKLRDIKYLLTKKNKDIQNNTDK